LLNWSTVCWQFSLIDRVSMMNCGLRSKMILASSWLLSIYYSYCTWSWTLTF